MKNVKEINRKKREEALKKIKLDILSLRAKGLNYQQIAYESGIAIDTMKRWSIGLSTPSDLSIYKWEKYINRKE